MAEGGSTDLFVENICKVLKEQHNFKRVTFNKDVTGGLVNTSGLFKLDDKDAFIKYAQRKHTLGMFTSEMESLNLLKKTGTIKIPEAHKVCKIPPDGACIIMDYMEGLKPMSNLWSDLGDQLARLHKYNIDLLHKEALNESNIHKSDKEAQDCVINRFGFHLPSYIGPEFQIQPCWESDWLEYFTRRQLEPQFVEIERKKGDSDIRKMWSELQRVVDIPFRDLTVEPSIVHGDFCNINIGEWQNQPVLFDPGCYYGHSETDFIIPSIESNFPPEFYQSYHKVLPKDIHFDTRQQLYKLFGYTLMYNVLGDVNIRKLTLQTGKDLLKRITQ